jgi:hypothetical protein
VMRGRVAPFRVGLLSSATESLLIAFSNRPMPCNEQKPSDQSLLHLIRAHRTLLSGVRLFSGRISALLRRGGVQNTFGFLSLSL